MPALYHGTSRAIATALAGFTGGKGTIDVGRGRGELGRGFYTQESSSNAARRGYTLYGTLSAVLVLDISEPEYSALNWRRLTLKMARRLDARLRKRNLQHSYTTVHDALVGPLIHQPRIEQQKFQSQTAQDLLNGPFTRRNVK